MRNNILEPCFVTLPLAFYFETETPVPIPKIIKSLAGLDKIARELPAFFTSLSGVEIDSCELKVRKIESGSLREVLDLALFFLNEDEKARFEAWMRTTKMGTATRYAAGLTLAGVAVLLVVSQTLNVYDHFAGTDTPSIQANNSVVMIAGSDIFNVPSSQLEAAAAAALQRDKKKLVGAALDFVKPAAGENAGGIYAGESAEAGVHISHEAARDAPASADFSVKNTDIPFENVTVDIRILNRDVGKGWIGYIPSVAQDQKLSLSFADGVDINSAKNDQIIQANVIVTYAQDPNKGTLSPKSAQITAVLD